MRSSSATVLISYSFSIATVSGAPEMQMEQIIQPRAQTLSLRPHPPQTGVSSEIPPDQLRSIALMVIDRVVRGTDAEGSPRA